ncbi:MAG: MlaD family protein [Kofleriaceae bacterium]|nr:MlaD family protein [Kofleriaceae bacterium]
MSLLAQDEQLTRKVGAITLLLLAASIGFVVFVLDRLELGARVRIRVYFAHTTGLKPNAPVIVAGRPVGRIESIETVSRGGADPLGGEGGSVAVVALEGDETWKVPTSAQIFVSSRGMLSERYLEVAPPVGEPGPPVTEGLELRGADPPALDSVLRRTWANMAVFKAFAEQVRPEWEAFQRALDALRVQLDLIAADVDALRPLVLTPSIADEARALVEEATTLRTNLGGADGLDQIAATLASARGTVAQLRRTVDQLAPLVARLALEARRVRGHLEAHDPIARGEAVLAQIRKAADKIDPMLVKLDEIRQRIERGEGSLGRLMKDPEFPEDAKELGKILKRKPWKVIARPRD